MLDYYNFIRAVRMDHHLYYYDLHLVGCVHHHFQSLPYSTNHHSPSYFYHFYFSYFTIANNDDFTKMDSMDCYYSC